MSFAAGKTVTGGSFLIAPSAQRPSRREPPGLTFTLSVGRIRYSTRVSGAHVISLL